MRNNLIICVTPLQMLIAEKIISMNPNVKFYCICYFYDNNEKYKYYIRKLKDQTFFTFEFLVVSNNKIMRLWDLLKVLMILKKIKLPKFATVYFASLDNPFIQLTLSHTKFSEIITFDDGTANLWANSLYNKPREISYLQVFFLSLLRVRYDMDIIKKESKKHYTIFNNSPFLKSKSEKIELINTSYLKDFVGDKNINIFIGQPYTDYNFNIFKPKNIKKIMNEFKIDSYFKHPRERVVYNFVEYVETNKIFEDYIFDLISNGYNVNIYTFLSTVALTVSGVNNVKIYSIADDELYAYFQEVYEIFEKNNVNVLRV